MRSQPACMRCAGKQCRPDAMLRLGVWPRAFTAEQLRSSSWACLSAAAHMCPLPSRRFWVEFTEWGPKVANLAGSIAYFFCLALWVTSLSAVRRRMYEVSKRASTSPCMHLLHASLHVRSAAGCCRLAAVGVPARERVRKAEQGRAQRAVCASCGEFPCVALLSPSLPRPTHSSQPSAPQCAAVLPLPHHLLPGLLLLCLRPLRALLVILCPRQAVPHLPLASLACFTGGGGRWWARGPGC